MFLRNRQFSFEAFHSSLFLNTIGHLVMSNVKKFILRHCFKGHHIGHYFDNSQRSYLHVERDHNFK